MSLWLLSIKTLRRKKGLKIPLEASSSNTTSANILEWCNAIIQKSNEINDKNSNIEKETISINGKYMAQTRSNLDAISIQETLNKYIESNDNVCVVCHSSKDVTFEQQQIARPDEPATLYFTCSNPIHDAKVMWKKRM